MNFNEALDYLANLTKFGVNLGLQRIEELLNRLGNPHLFLKSVHIGGTNGKGSTAVMLANILQAAGYRVGMFTSPHLHSYCERFRINGKKISESRLAGLLTELRPYLTAMVSEGFEHPTEFEVSTVLAFQYFYQEKVDFLVLEVGMGGTLDSTNVVIPLLSVITNVSIDHTDYLGKTVREIAGVKCGIIKPGVPVVTAALQEEALTVISETCRARGAPLTLVGRDITWRRQFFSLSGQYISVQSHHCFYENLWLPLLGRHQQINAVTSVAAVELLVEQGVMVDGKQLRDGFAATAWPARLEILHMEPPVLLDGAHNYAGAKSLRQAWADYFPDKKVILVIGMLADKERAKVVAELTAAARAVIITKPDSPRAENWRELAELVRRRDLPVYLLEKTGDALNKAFSLAASGDLICVTGSLYLVAEARKLLLRK